MTHTAMGMRTRRERKDTAEGNSGSERLAGGRPADHIVCGQVARIGIDDFAVAEDRARRKAIHIDVIGEVPGRADHMGRD